MTAGNRYAAIVAMALAAGSLACPTPIKTISDALACTDLVDAKVGAPREVRLVMLYTTSAIGVDGAVAVETEIEGAVRETNVALEMSGVPLRYVLAHVEAVAYTEGADATMLSDLTSGSGALSVAPTLRARHHADVVGLVRSGLGGISHIMDVPSLGHRDKAFLVVGRDDMGAVFMLAHELGHILGGVHKRGVAPVPRYLYVYPHACTTCIVDGRLGWHTIMSGPLFTSTGITHVIGLYANPDVNYFGVPTGIPIANALAADERTAFWNSSSLVAAFTYTPAWFVSLRGEGPWLEKKVDQALMADVRIGDFDADGLADAFTVNAITGEWLVSFQASQPWKVIWDDPLKVPLRDLRFGDFDADGKTDVFHADLAGDQWLTWKGAGAWEVLNTTAATADVPVDQLAFGHMDANKKSDVFWSNAATGVWSVASDGTGSWQVIPHDATLKLDTSLLRLADFNGDGVMDVFRSEVGENKWYVFKTGASAWETLNGPDAELTLGVSELVIGDFTGDQTADVVVPNGSGWGMARSGQGRLQLLKLSCARADNMATGDFDGDGAVDVLRAGIRP